MQDNASQQAYCLERMGVVSWLPKSAVVSELTLSRPISPWDTELTSSISEDNCPTSHDETATGFALNSVVSSSMDMEVTQKTVAGLKEELLSNSSVIVEDLQPIEELAVDIAPQTVFDETLVHDICIQLYVVEKRLIILTQVPKAFDDFNEIEQLALKMSQALLRQTTDEWVSARFSWPDKLHNPYFIENTDWMLSALDSFIERYLDGLDRPVMIVAGTQIQKMVSSLRPEAPIMSFPRADIVSLPELYRIPELKREAWAAMKKVME
ncbi:hypothetical protein O1D97_18485 [Marinomonas sp. 15G1-11]|uniref:Uncharacterized protein n=1 Tax=Marinomonas phaeophyticola TaxID=3004091 RepID=A0ABT4JZ94_9GAMM|nr:hypothetical protein [Marinomonas sp. 15G1-11]MCZ2723541.1 hypothetical protein [Marinomonas sp. 15G1-11]